MNAPSNREFRLSPSGYGRGISCDANGAYIDTVPLLKRTRNNAWTPRDSAELSDALGAHYGLPVDLSAKSAGLEAIARALNAGDIARAQLVTLHLQVPQTPQLDKSASPYDDTIAFIRGLDASGILAKAWDGEQARWPAGAPDSQGGRFAPKDSDNAFESDTTDTIDTTGDTHMAANEARAGGTHTPDSSNDGSRDTGAIDPQPAQDAQAADATPSTLPDGVDWGFIAAREGARTDGYVPQDANGDPAAHSGVTLAVGFDLGGRSVAELNALDLPDDLVRTLTPYLGLRGQAAQDYLDAHPLSITDAQQQLIDTPSFNHYYDQVSQNFNAASDGVRFQDLPRDAQTAIVSVAYQYGINLASATPHFWNQITGGQWQQARDNLMNFGDAYPSRRRLEAGLLTDAINSGALPESPPGN